MLYVDLIIKILCICVETFDQNKHNKYLHKNVQIHVLNSEGLWLSFTGTCICILLVHVYVIMCTG